MAMPKWIGDAKEMTQTDRHLGASPLPRALRILQDIWSLVKNDDCTLRRMIEDEWMDGVGE